MQSKDKNEQFSGKLNQLVNGYLKQEKKLTLIHHYYVNKVQFPGYRSSFSYKDIALSEQLLEEVDLKMISGHLHLPFQHKNYLCVGSAWATSPLESNQLKGFFSLNQGELCFFGQQLINYFELETKELVDEQFLSTFFENLIQQTKKNLVSTPFYQGSYCEYPELDLKKTILTLKVNQLDYEQVDQWIASELRTQLLDFRLKKSSAQVKDLLTQLEKPDQDQLQTF